jgi:Fic family protein
MKINNKKINEFLKESNAIESVYGTNALYAAWNAWDFAYKNRKKIDIPYILEIHRLLLKNLNPRIAGKFRDCDVMIGGRHCIFVSESLFKQEIKKIIKFMIEEGLYISKTQQAKSAHIMFEHLHPFEDGNGRVGRILWQIHRISLGLPIKIIHTGKEQQEYYKWF